MNVGDASISNAYLIGQKGNKDDELRDEVHLTISPSSASSFTSLKLTGYCIIL